MTTPNRGGSLIGKIGSYLQIFAKDPSSTAFVPLAEAYRQIGLLDDALEAARLGTKMLPHFSPGFSTMGRILGQMGRIDEAMSAYAKALSIDRQSQSALVGLARLHLIRAERDMARKILKEAKTFHPDDEKIADMLIALDLPRPWAEIKQASQSQEPVSPVSPVVPTSDKPGEPIPTATLAEIYVKQGLLDKGIKIYHDILKQSPENATARARMLELQGQLNDRSEVLDDEQPLEAGPIDEKFTDTASMIPESNQSSLEIQSVPVEQSALTVLKSWLNAIKLGRTNV